MSEMEDLYHRNWHGHTFEGFVDDICGRCGMTVEAVEDWSGRCGQVYVRQRKMILNILTGEQEDFKSKNAAKRRSRELQLADGGGLGAGLLRVIRPYWPQ